MKLWHLEPIRDDGDVPTAAWLRNPYGATWALVVRAEDEAEARAIAIEFTSKGHNLRAEYGDPSLTSCVELTPDGPSEVICDNTGTG